ncbi:MAG: hypothetical protein SOV85_15385 [Clostridium sp.]|uniref:hypothetical protein n=1 Tax=Clostridium sp. TaxID=1506 RepID=UPI0025B9E5CC|nr:hypothetical protein [Clostridium sp.]MDY2632709.1 hypothetical protein [Clostridium sp.]
MIKEYKIDENKKREIENTQYKKHPKWKKNVWVLKTFDVIAIISPIIIIANYYIRFINVYWDLFDSIITALTVIFIIIMTKIGYIRILRFTCDDSVSFKINETLIVTDNYFENSYKPDGEGFDETRDIMRVKYKDIDRLLLNKYHNRLRVWGNIKDIRYFNYEKKDLDYSSYEKMGMTFYLYYENSDEFVKTLVEKSGVELEVIDCPEV